MVCLINFSCQGGGGKSKCLINPYPNLVFVRSNGSEIKVSLTRGPIEVVVDEDYMDSGGNYYLPHFVQASYDRNVLDGGFINLPVDTYTVYATVRVKEFQKVLALTNYKVFDYEDMMYPEHAANPDGTYICDFGLETDNGVEHTLGIQSISHADVHYLKEDFATASDEIRILYADRYIVEQHIESVHLPIEIHYAVSPTLYYQQGLDYFQPLRLELALNIL